MSSGNEQEYVVYKNKKRRSRRQRTAVVTPLVVEEAPHSTTSETTENESSINSVEKENSDVISNIIRMRWHNDMVAVQNTRKMFGLPADGGSVHPSAQLPQGMSEFPGPQSPQGPPGPPGPPGLLEPQSPINFFENSRSARMFQIAQQHPAEYIPVPAMQPYMVPLYPNKEFYEGHGFIPTEFLA